MDFSGLSRINRIRLFVLSSAIVAFCVVGYMLAMDGPHENGGPDASDEIDDELLYEVLYNESYLGYNSVITTGGGPIGLPDDVELIDTTDLKLPIYAYPETELTDEYVDEMVDRFFPELDVDNMTVGLSSPTAPDSAYVVIENATVELRLLKNGGLEYDVNDKLGTGDIIESEDKAIELARTYLKDHGGIPGDIDDTRTHAIHFADFTAKDSHLYSVRFYRNASEYMIQGFSMRNMMIMKFDGSDGSLMYFEWHWPDFKRAYELTGITSIKETLKHYGMDSNSSDRHNITNISIMFYVPVPVQKSAYDVSAKIYYIAPYWAVSTDTNTYYLGMVTKDG